MLVQDERRRPDNSNVMNIEYRNIQQQQQLAQETRVNKTMFKWLHSLHQIYIGFRHRVTHPMAKSYISALGCCLVAAKCMRRN